MCSPYMRTERRTMRIAVTGGAGFIGSALCRYLVSDVNCSVLNIDKLTYAGNLRSLETISDNKNYDYLQADICDFQALSEAFVRFEPDAVIHAAAETHVDRSIAQPHEFIQSNAVGTYVLLEASRAYWEQLERPRQRRFRFLHVSTDEVYGSLEDKRSFNESSPYDPSSPYSASKAASDHFVLAWHHTYGFPAILSNCTNNYGPYQFPEKLIPRAILNALDGLPIPIYGDGSHVRDWIYVEDCVCALHQVLLKGSPGERYNVGARNARCNLQLVEQLCGTLDEFVPSGRPHNRLITFVEDRPGHDARYAIDPSKIETQTGWHARESIGSGLEKTVAWYIANRQWWEPLCRDVYLATRRDARTANYP